MTEEGASRLWQIFKEMYGQKWVCLFQGDEAIETWRITWSRLDVTVGQIKIALSRLPREFPEWPPTYGQFLGLCGPKPMLALPKPDYHRPPPAVVEAFVDAAKPHSIRGWWKPDQIVTAAQARLVVEQARHFGQGSAAGKFLSECKAVGSITPDNRCANPEEPT